jgi:hypothetical protein
MSVMAVTGMGVMAMTGVGIIAVRAVRAVLGVVVVVVRGRGVVVVVRVVLVPLHDFFVRLLRHGLFGVRRVSRLNGYLVGMLALVIRMGMVVPVVVRSIFIMPVVAHVYLVVEGVRSHLMIPAGGPVARRSPGR